MNANEVEKESTGYVGKLRYLRPCFEASKSEECALTSHVGHENTRRANFVGTEFTIYDKGLNPKDMTKSQIQAAMLTVRQELGTVFYVSVMLHLTRASAACLRSCAMCHDTGV